jgi:hypothetical protein
MLPTKFRFIWPGGFRGEDKKKSTYQKQELPVAAMFVNGSGQNVQHLERTYHRCFLPSFSSFGWGFTEKTIKMWKVNGQQTMDAKWWQKLILPLARWAKNGWKVASVWTYGMLDRKQVLTILCKQTKIIHKRLKCSTTTSKKMLKYNKNNNKSTKRL